MTDDLLQQAKELLDKYYLAGTHHIVCLLQCGQALYPALHLNSSGYDICAEPIAVANAIFAGEHQFDQIVALTSDGRPGGQVSIVPPCGDCRQVLLEYAPTIKVLIEVGGEITRVPIQDLLPFPYKKPRKKRSMN